MGEKFGENPAFKDQLSSSSGGSIDSALTSAAPSPRPGLSRTSSVNYSVEADDSFTGLTLLDALVVLDSHLDLARRQISRKGQEWKSRAESTAVSVKRQAEEVLNQRRIRRRVTTNAEDDKNERIDIDREVAKFRKNIQSRVQAVRTRWRDQRVVTLRDKLSFFFGVELVLVSALLVGFRPQWIPGFYTALSLYLFPIRIYEYRKRHFSLFLADLCYIVNAMCLLYIWVFPGSPILFVACYCLSHGPLCTAIATWRNSLVFHSVEKVTSLFIHIYPPFVFTVLRHFYPNVTQAYPALAELPRLNIARSLVFSSIAYLIWQVCYYYGIIVARKEKIEKEGRVTSFTWMLNNKRSLIGKTLAKIPPARREASFMAGQFVYTFVTMAPSAIWLYDSKFLSVVWIITFFSVSVWNGASFYFKVMGSYKEVAALKKELDELQKEVDGRKTPASISSMPSAGSGDVPNDMTLGPSAMQYSPVLSASGEAGSPSLAPLSSPEMSMKRSLSQPFESSPLARGAVVAGGEERIPELRLDDGTSRGQPGSSGVSSSSTSPTTTSDKLRAREDSLSESDSSAVVVSAEEGREAEDHKKKK